MSRSCLHDFCHRCSSSQSLTTRYGTARLSPTLRLASHARDCNGTERRHGEHPLARFFAITRCLPPSGQHGTIFLGKVKHTSESAKTRWRSVFCRKAMCFTMEELYCSPERRAGNCSYIPGPHDQVTAGPQ
jgi:hypothetical protein